MVMRKKRKGVRYRTIPAHTRAGIRVKSYRRIKRTDIRKNRTIKKRK